MNGGAFTLSTAAAVDTTYVFGTISSSEVGAAVADGDTLTADSIELTFGSEGAGRGWSLEQANTVKKSNATTPGNDRNMTRRVPPGVRFVA